MPSKRALHYHLLLLLRSTINTNSSTHCSPVFPIAFSILIGFVVAQIFFAVYEMAIDTILLAFCEDCETNGGNPKWAPPLLMEAMGLDANDMKPAPPLAVKSNAIAPEA